MEKAEC